MSLSILCISSLEPHASHFIVRMSLLAERIGAEFVLAVDGDAPVPGHQLMPRDVVGRVQSKGFLESVLDDGIALCSGDYILRLDDDEQCSPAMVAWLAERKYLSGELWTFPRTHMWPNAKSVIMTSPLFPDNQTRLSTKAKAGGRGERPHQMSPFGMGDVAQVTIEHHKFLVRSYAERQVTAKKWHDGIQCSVIFSLPEDLCPTLDVVEAGDGSIPWTPSWQKTMTTRGTK